MKTRIWSVIGSTLLVATALGQPPQDKEADQIRLKVKLEFAELDREVERDLLKESLLLLRRAERSLQVERDRPDEQQKKGLAELESLREFVEKLRKQFEAHLVDSAMLRRELAESEKRMPSPNTKEAALAEQAQLDFLKQAGKSRRTEAREAAAKPEELGEPFETAELDLNLLNTQLNIISTHMHQSMQTLAALEVRAAMSEDKKDEKLQHEIESARKQYGEIRKSYLDVKKKVSEQMAKMRKFRQTPEQPQYPGSGSF